MMKKIKFTGLHIFGEIETDKVSKLKSLNQTKKFLEKIIKKYHLHKLGEIYYQFKNGGFTALVGLTESHISIHTWPEFHYLTLDVYLCNFKKDNTEVTKKIFDDLIKFYHPKNFTKRVLKR